MRPRNTKAAVLVLALSIGAAIGIWNLPGRPKDVAFGDFMRDVDTGKITAVTISGQHVSGVYGPEHAAFQTYAPAQYVHVANDLQAKGIAVRR